LAIDLKGKEATKTEKNKNPKAIKAKRVLLIGTKRGRGLGIGTHERPASMAYSHSPVWSGLCSSTLIFIAINGIIISGLSIFSISRSC